MSFDLDLRITRARTRLHRALDDSVELLHEQHARDMQANRTWLDSRATFYRRSIGQLNRHLKARKP